MILTIEDSDILDDGDESNVCFVVDGHKYADKLQLGDLVKARQFLWYISDIIFGYHSFSLRNHSSYLVGYKVEKVAEPRKAARVKKNGTFVLEVPRGPEDYSVDSFVYSFGDLWKIRSIPYRGTEESHLELIKVKR